MMFVLGYFFQALYAKAVDGLMRGNLFWIYLYIYASGYLSMSSLEDKIFRSFFTITTILFIIWDLIYTNRSHQSSMVVRERHHIKDVGYRED